MFPRSRLDVERTWTFEQKCHFSEDIAGCQDPDDVRVVAHFKGAFEDDENVACAAALLQHTVAGFAVDDVAARNTSLCFVVGEAVERGDVLGVEFVERSVYVVPVLLGREQRLTVHGADVRQDSLNTTGKGIRLRVESNSSQSVDVGKECDQRNEISPLGLLMLCSA